MNKARRAKSSTRLYALLGGIALLGAGALGYAATQRSEPDYSNVDPSLAAQAEGYLLGRPDAPVQIIEFADFECPGCAQFATVTEPDVRKRIVEAGDANFRFFDFPLPMHPNSWPASNAAACAHEQGKFWEMHDRIFAGQTEWNGQATSRPKGVFQGYAREIGLDVARWEQCYDDQRQIKRVQANAAEANRRNVESTPTVIVAGRVIGNPSYDEVKAAVDSAKAAAARGTAPSPAPRDSAASAPVPKGR